MVIREPAREDVTSTAWHWDVSSDEGEDQEDNKRMKNSLSQHLHKLGKCIDYHQWLNVTNSDDGHPWA